MSAVKPSIRDIVFAQMRADPRKTAVLVFLVVVMGVLYGRWFLSRGTPAEAQAAPPVAAIAPPSAGPTGPTSGVPASMPSTSRTVVSRPVAHDLQSDPFALNLDRFPPGREANKAPAAAPAPAVEDPIEAAARTLVLQSTLCGQTPMACINGVFARPGQRVNGFVLEKVEPTRVVLGREGVQVELYLK